MNLQRTTVLFQQLVLCRISVEFVFLHRVFITYLHLFVDQWSGNKEYDFTNVRTNLLFAKRRFSRPFSMATDGASQYRSKCSFQNELRHCHESNSTVDRVGKVIIEPYVLWRYPIHRPYPAILQHAGSSVPASKTDIQRTRAGASFLAIGWL